MAKEVSTKRNGDTGGAVQQQPARNVFQQFRHDLEAMKSQFAIVLPPKTTDKFYRNGLTYVQKHQRLMACTSQSVLQAFMEAATDQLMVDGKEAAIIPYGEDEDGRGRADVAKYMPMYFGIRKKVLASGKLADWNVQCVYEGDEFDFQLGDDPFIHHRPSMKGGRTRKVIAAYSIATFNDGTKSREVMNGDQIEDIRRKSKAKRGPWSDPVFYGEMARKTVARLHAKQLPMPNDIEVVLSRDDDLYDLTATTSEPPQRRMPAPGSARAVLDHFARGDDVPAQADTTDAAPPEALPSPGVQPEADAHHDGDPRDDVPAWGKPGGGHPKTEAEYVAYAEAQIDAWGTVKVLTDWWSSAEQRKLRNTCNVVRDTYDMLDRKVKARATELEFDVMTHEIYRGYEIDEDHGDFVITEANGEVVCSQPSLELAYKWIDAEHRRRLEKAMR